MASAGAAATDSSASWLSVLWGEPAAYTSLETPLNPAAKEAETKKESGAKASASGALKAPELDKKVGSNGTAGESGDSCNGVIVVMGPVLFTALGFYIQSVGLHIATYRYVHKYAPNAAVGHAINDTLEDPLDEWLLPKLGFLHYSQVGIIDKAALAIPGSFFLLSVGIAVCNLCRKSSLGRGMATNAAAVWTKTLLCAGTMFIMKGLLGCMTVVPDARGWGVCQEESLKQDGAAWMREEHSLSELFSLDFLWYSKHHRMLRYCADMMYSGHTFATTISALGFYEMVCTIHIYSGVRWLPCCQKGTAISTKVLVLVVFSTCIITSQIIEILLVEKDHFHYSMDIFMALLMSFLWFTNGIMAVASAQWARHGYRVFGRACASPLACLKRCKRVLSGRVKFETDVATETHMKCKELVPDLEDFVPLADIFMPWCCVPCCCYAGRQHIYNDDQLQVLIGQYAKQRAQYLLLCTKRVGTPMGLEHKDPAWWEKKRAEIIALEKKAEQGSKRADELLAELLKQTMLLQLKDRVAMADDLSFGDIAHLLK